MFDHNQQKFSRIEYLKYRKKLKCNQKTGIPAFIGKTTSMTTITNTKTEKLNLNDFLLLKEAVHPT